MSATLSDNEIKKLIGVALIGADASLVNPNGIQMRLGKEVYFPITEESMTLAEGDFLQISPGETAHICSLEEIDFSLKTVQNLHPGAALMAYITPTTTAMREGIAGASTKVDAGFKGVLNWSIRNSTDKKIVLEHGQPLFKLTVVKLTGAEEIPENFYGDRDADFYQNQKGIAPSRRLLPANLPKEKVKKSGFLELDPAKQLQKAGEPFGHIGKQLKELHGKFEIVSKDVSLLADRIENVEKGLSSFKSAMNEEFRRMNERFESMSEKIDVKFDALRNLLFKWFVGVFFAIATLTPVIFLLIDRLAKGG